MNCIREHPIILLILLSIVIFIRGEPSSCFLTPSTTRQSKQQLHNTPTLVPYQRQHISPQLSVAVATSPKMFQNERGDDNDGEGGWEEVISPSSRRRKAIHRSKNKTHNSAHTKHNHPAAHPIATTTESTNNPINRLPSMIILVGIPGSGKSTFAQTLSTIQPDRYVRVNQDTLKTRARCESTARRALNEGKIPVVDRCNFDPEQRLTFLNLVVSNAVAKGASDTGIGNGTGNGNANGHDGEGRLSSVDCIVFDCGTEECVRRCMEREGHPSIQRGNARVVVKKMARLLKIPKVGDAEGFRNVRRVGSMGEGDRLAEEYLDGLV